MLDRRSFLLTLVVLVAFEAWTLPSVHGWQKYKRTYYSDYVTLPEIEPDASDPKLVLESYPHLLGVVASMCPKDDPHLPPDQTTIRIYRQSGSKVDLELRSMALAVERLVNNGFNISQPTVLYAHGWFQNGESEWLQTLREQHNIISRINSNDVRHFNLLIFDWSQASSKPYQDSVKHIPEVGTRLAKFFHALNQRFKYSMDQLHLVGYSLGAQIVGVAGRHLAETGNKVHQITGLDPAGPCFYSDTNFARKFTLGPDAADIVIARHYSYGMLGARGASGDIDIYVNGGMKQPDSNLNKIYQIVPGAPEHSGAVIHENRIAAASNGCHSIAYKCDSYAKFNEGRCADCRGSGCYNIDLFAHQTIQKPPQSIKMFLKTGFDQKCLHHYQVVAQIKPNMPINVKSAFRAGRVRLEIGSETLVAITKSELRCDNNIVYTALIASEDELTNLNEIKFVYYGTGTKLVKVKDFEVVRLNYMSHPEAQVRRSKSLTFCPNESSQDILEPCSSPYKGKTC